MNWQAKQFLFQDSIRRRVDAHERDQQAKRRAARIAMAFAFALLAVAILLSAVGCNGKRGSLEITISENTGCMEIASVREVESGLVFRVVNLLADDATIGIFCATERENRMGSARIRSRHAADVFVPLDHDFDAVKFEGVVLPE